jgi:hypothetical protein
MRLQSILKCAILQIMNIQQEIADIEQRLADAGESVGEYCKRAGINRSTWTRWKAGATAPNMRSWQRVIDAAQEGRAA